MKDVILNLLHYSEYLIPLIFFWFTHFIDEKIHKHWENADYHPDKAIRLINRYQWEVCFLVISLLAILGIKVAHKEEELFFYSGLLLLIGAVLFIILLCVFAIRILDDEQQRMSPVVFYASVAIYIFYITADIFFQAQPGEALLTVRNVHVPRYFIFLLGALTFLLLFVFFKRRIDNKLRVALLSSDDVDHNISIYKSGKTSSVKKAEALDYIIKFYHRRKNDAKVQEWLEKGKVEYPGKTERIKKRLGL